MTGSPPDNPRIAAFDALVSNSPSTQYVLQGIEVATLESSEYKGVASY